MSAIANKDDESSSKRRLKDGLKLFESAYELMTFNDIHVRPFERFVLVNNLACLHQTLGDTSRAKGFFMFLLCMIMSGECNADQEKLDGMMKNLMHNVFESSACSAPSA